MLHLHKKNKTSGGIATSLLLNEPLVLRKKYMKTLSVT
nr:MAG TPA: hypothetical protein [Caudoviricetes sp.]